jgi:tetratricopeptide (TPR) repeat protein
MDKSKKLGFVQEKNLGPVDDLREELKRLEEIPLEIKSMDSEQALTLLNDLDRVVATFEELDPEKNALTGEWGRFGAVQGRLRKNARKLFKALGGEEVLHRQRPKPAPPTEHWWWYLDEILAEQRRRSLKRVGIFGAVALVIIGVLVVLFNTILKPSPEAVARLNAENEAYTAFEQEGDFDAALAAVDEGLVAVPNDPSLLLLKGVFLQLLDRESKADDAFSLAQELIDDPVEYLLARAQVYLRTGQIEQSEDDVMAALELNDEFARSWMMLGQTLEMQGRLLEAMEAFQIASDLAFENDENEVYVVSRMAIARMAEALPAMSLEERAGTVEPTSEATGE